MSAKESVEQFQVLKELAKQFQDLIKERDQRPYYEHEIDPRCVEIDDVLIPQIIKKVPKGMMAKFNELINKIDFID